MRWLRACVVMTMAACVSAAYAQGAHEDVRWYAIVDHAGARLGHASFQIAPHESGRELIETQEIYLRELEGAARRSRTRTVTVEDAAGRVVSISETTRAGQYEARREAVVTRDRAVVTSQTPSGSTQAVVMLPPGVRFDAGEAPLRAWRPGRGDLIAFDNFNLDSASVERVEIEALSAHGEHGFEAVRRRFERGQLRGVARLEVDGAGRIAEVAQPMFGATIHMIATDRAGAVRRHAPYQIVPGASIASPFRIPASAQRGRIRYRFAFRDALTFTPPGTGDQRVSIEDGAAILDICAGCGPGLASDAASLADALRPTAWLQADHPRLREIAEPVARLEISDARKMEMLLERARPYLEQFDYNGHYSALDTIVRRAGDCTEAAVLLAALGRAAGIPTKVASGLSYSRQSYHGVSNAFIAHSWVLAYVDGAWRSFDLALLEFDATHIALTIGDGDPRSIAAAGQLASLLRLDSLVEVRSRVAG